MNNKLNRDQRGLVSFMVTLIMMMVISLIVIGFTQVTNSNRREQLDRQLSTQAFYAAESGVNVAVSKIKADIKTTGNVKEQKTCADSYYASSSLNSDGSVGYTCTLVRPVVKQITTSANTATSTIFKINLANSDATNYALSGSLVFDFTWAVKVGGDPDGSKCAPTSGSFPTTSSNMCNYALLRVDLLKVPTSGTVDPSTLADSTATFYIQPVKSGAAPINVAPPNRVYVGGANCSSTAKTCTGSIAFSSPAALAYVASVATGGEYYVRVSTLYNDTNKLTISARSSGGGDIYFKNAQAIVDVTGKAQDVLRRVQVTIPFQQYDTNLIPEGAIQSVVDVCKQFTIYGGANAYNGCPGS